MLIFIGDKLRSATHFSVLSYSLQLRQNFLIDLLTSKQAEFEGFIIMYNSTQAIMEAEWVSGCSGAALSSYSNGLCQQQAFIVGSNFRRNLVDSPGGSISHSQKNRSVCNLSCSGTYNSNPKAGCCLGQYIYTSYHFMLPLSEKWAILGIPSSSGECWKCKGSS